MGSAHQPLGNVPTKQWLERQTRSLPFQIRQLSSPNTDSTLRGLFKVRVGEAAWGWPATYSWDKAKKAFVDYSNR